MNWISLDSTGKTYHESFNCAWSAEKIKGERLIFSPLSEKIGTSYFVSYFFSNLILFLKSLTFFHFSHTFCWLNLILFLILFFQSHTFSHTFCTFISYFYFFGSGRSVTVSAVFGWTRSTGYEYQFVGQPSYWCLHVVHY